MFPAYEECLSMPQSLALEEMEALHRMEGNCRGCKALGMKAAPYCRKRIGDFACYTTLIRSLHAR